MPPPSIAVIPARLASQRLPRKPLALLGGEPLIVRVCEAAASAGVFDRVVVAADSAEVVNAVERAGYTAVLTDPALPSGTDRVAAAAQLMAVPSEAVIVNVQGDEPFVDATCLRALVDRVRTLPTAVATPVVPITDVGVLADPNAVKVAVGTDGRALYFSRASIPYSRDAPGRLSPKLHWRHLGLYAYTHASLARIAAYPPHPLEQLERLEQLRWLAHGEHVACVAVGEAHRGIDTPADLALANELFAKRAATP